MENEGRAFHVQREGDVHQVPIIDIAECSRRMANLEAAVGELVRQQAAMTVHLQELANHRGEVRAEIASIAAWLREQAVGAPVLLKRVSDVEADVTALEGKIVKRLDTHDEKLQHLQTIVERMMGIGIAASILWAIYGDAIKHKFTGGM